MGFDKYIKTFVDESDLAQAVELDKLCYKEIDRVPLDTVVSWNKKFPQIYTFLMRKDEVIGYINFMPISDEIYAKFVGGKFKDQSITANDIIIPEAGGSYHFLFMSVVIKEDYRNTNALLLLMNAFYRNWKKYFKDNHITVKSVIADCVNKDIEEFVINSGFKLKFSDEDSKIYEGNIF